MENNAVYPFTAIAGQEDMKLALILNLINPKLGGVLIRGEKGTAKSTAVRGLTELLEQRRVVKGCPFHCSPDELPMCSDCSSRENYETVFESRKVVELPVSATEDRVVGSLNIERAIKDGEKVFEPGILADSNGNILYVDEINLLDDHIVDILLDSAAMGVNTVEREGVSYSHPARFILVGTMNPEEGELRPQLLDRFGLVAEVHGERDIETRKEIMTRRLDFERDPVSFCRRWSGAQAGLKAKIAEAGRNLSSVIIPDDMLTLTAEICIKLEVDGHRADITLIKTACTLAAFEGKAKVGREELLRSASMVLPHRLHRRPFQSDGEGLEALEKLLNE